MTRTQDPMPDANPDPNGNVPDDSPVALIVIDMINDLEFEGGEQVLDAALAVADRIDALKRAARAAAVPTIYVNDNFGRWRSDFRQVVERCLRPSVRGRPVAERLRPDPRDYFVLKPKHSAFFATTLETLLGYLGCRRLILTGMATDICVLFTASDAYMRDFRVHVPADCCAGTSREEHERALAFMRRVLCVDTRPSNELDLERLRRSDDARV